MPKRERTKLKYIWKVNGTYHFRDSFDKVRVECSLKTDNWEVAKLKATEIRQKYDPALAVTSKVRFGEIVPQFMEYQERRLASDKIRAGTMKEYRQIIGDHLLESFEWAFIKDIANLWNRYTETKTVRLENHVKVMLQILKFAKRQNLLDVIPVLDIPKKPRRDAISLRDNEILALFNHLNDNAKLYTLMSLTMAMRRKEIMTLRWTDISWEARALHLDKEITKTKKNRVVVISDDVLPMLKERFEKRTLSSPFIFVNRRDPKRHMDVSGLRGSLERARVKAMNELAQAANTPAEKAEVMDRFERFVPHDFRRTWESRAHLRSDLTDTQREKFAGASIKVQKDVYVIMEADQLRPLANVINVSDLKENQDLKSIEWGKSGEKSK